MECPLIKRDIDTSYCYEITGVAYGLVKPSLVDDDIGDRHKAEQICNKCENNQWK